MTFKNLSEFVAAQGRCAGALMNHIVAFATALSSRGYAESTAKQHVRLAAEFGRWLGRKEVLVFEVDERRIAEFLSYLRRRGRAARSHFTTLRILLGVLRDSGAARMVDAKIDASPVADIERTFARHLAEERGLHTSTITHYTRCARRFLLRRFRGGCVRLGELRAADVTRFIADEARARPRCMPVIVPALRVFLRWLQQRGRHGNRSDGVRPSRGGVAAGDAAQGAPDRARQASTAALRSGDSGRTARLCMLLLLARLGLRAGELVSMELDDINWDSGDLVVRSKGGREDRLPLPRDVGAAVAAYLRDGRPSCSTRRLFVRAKAPHRGFISSVAICDIVKRGLTRAGLNPPRKGAHTLRHALACTMLRHGASLAEIGQILRHRSPDTTAIYAKVDLVALRALAHVWPQHAGDA